MRSGATLPRAGRDNMIDRPRLVELSRRPAVRGNMPRTPVASPRDMIRDHALALGFDAIGFCEARLGPEARERLGRFLAAGQHGDMGRLAARAEQPAHTRRVWPE